VNRSVRLEKTKALFLGEFPEEETGENRKDGRGQDSPECQ